MKDLVVINLMIHVSSNSNKNKSKMAVLSFVSSTNHPGVFLISKNFFEGCIYGSQETKQLLKM